MRITFLSAIQIQVIGTVKPNPFFGEPDEPRYLVEGFDVYTLEGFNAPARGVNRADKQGGGLRITHLLPDYTVEELYLQMISQYHERQAAHTETLVQEQIETALQS